LETALTGFDVDHPIRLAVQEMAQIVFELRQGIVDINVVELAEWLEEEKSMREAVIVSTARTAIGKAFRGAFNKTPGAVMGGHAVQYAVQRAGVDPSEVEDVILGCAMPEGGAGRNVARLSAIRAELPVTAAGSTVHRACSSGLQAISMAAHRIVLDHVPVMVAGGVETISLMQNSQNQYNYHEEWLMRHKPELWMPMIDTADIVAERYGTSREAQDEYALTSQQRTAAAQQAGRFDDEIVPLTAVKEVIERETGETYDEEVTLEKDEGNRPDTTAERLAGLKPVMGDDKFQAMRANFRTVRPPAC